MADYRRNEVSQNIRPRHPGEFSLGTPDFPYFRVHAVAFEEDTEWIVDPSVADHSITSGNDEAMSLYDVVTAIGTSMKATVRFIRRSSESTTTYALASSLDLKAYTNIRFKFDRGAIIAPATTKTVTFLSPRVIVADPDQQCFGGAGAISFYRPGEVFPEWWGIDGTADQVQVTAAFTSLTAGGVVTLAGDAYTFTENCVMQSGCRLKIEMWTTVTLAATATGTSLVYALNETNIAIEGGGTLNGNRANVSGGDYAHGIFLNTCERVRVGDIKVTGAHKDNMYLVGCTNVRVKDSDIEDSEESGLFAQNCVNLKIDGCRFKDNLNAGGVADILIYTGNVDVILSANSHEANGTNVTGQCHAVYTIGSSGVIMYGCHVRDKYGWGIEIQPAATGEGYCVFGNQVRDCGNETDQTGGIFLSGEHVNAFGNFITGSAIDGINIQGADGSIIAINIITDSGDSDTDGYALRFAGAASDRTIIVGNQLRDHQGTKTTKQALYLSTDPAIIVGNYLDETEDGYLYCDGNDPDHIFIGNNYGTRSAGAWWQGDRGRNAQYVGDLTDNATFDRNNFKFFLVGASGANRNLNPTGTWHAGDDVWIHNTGLANNIVFDSTGANQALTPGQTGIFQYNGNSSTWEVILVA